MPLNLSIRGQEKDSSPSDHRPSCSDVEESKTVDQPLNLSLQASHDSPAHRPAPSTSEDLQQGEREDEPCDQRQTAALALCQLASASSAISLCDSSKTAKKPNPPKKNKKTTKSKATGVKRANSSTESNCHKPKKRVKAAERAVRRRPRCCWQLNPDFLTILQEGQQIYILQCNNFEQHKMNL